MVIDAKSGIQATTEKLIEYLKQSPKPAFFVINKLDQENADFSGTVEKIKSSTWLNLIPITIPIGEGESFCGVIDLLQNQSYLYKNGESQGVKSAVDETKKSKARFFRFNVFGM